MKRTYSWLLQLFVFLRFASIICVQGDEHPGEDPSFNCDQAILSIEINTDGAPNETSWEILAAYPKYSHDFDDSPTYYYEEMMSSDPYDEPFQTDVKKYCISQDVCLKFRIYDSGGNGLCCENNHFEVRGSYEVKWMGSIVAEGSEFGDMAESDALFGLDCPTDAPSYAPVKSMGPSVSDPPSSRPTISSQPSSRPTISSQPSVMPSLSSIPTITPTATEVILFPKVDIYNRRLFPQLEEEYQTISTNTSTLPNCKEFEDTVGCISHPKTDFLLPLPPEWVGNLRFQPPTCQRLGRNNRCYLNNPSTRKNAYPATLTSVSLELLDNEDSLVELLPNTVKPLAIAVGDVDGDGLEDIVFGIKDGPNQLLINADNSVFEDPIELVGTHTTSNDVALADFNGDGLLDIVFANNGAQNQLLLNNGNVSSSSPFNLMNLPGDALAQTKAIAIGDIDRDGNLDIFVGNKGMSNVLILNKGRLDFELIDMDDSFNTFSVALGYIDGNKDIDVVIGNMTPDNNQIIFNPGNTGIYTPQKLPHSADVDTKSIVVGDVDGDSSEDIVFGTTSSKNILLLNRGDNTFDKVTLPGSTQDTHEILLGDLDGDGLIDILESNSGNHRAVINRGETHFDVLDLPHDVSSGGDPMAMINLSNSTPVAVVMGSRIVLSNAGEKISVINFPDESTSAKVVAIGDFDNNSFMDIIVGSESGLVQLLSNPGDGTYVPFDIATFLEAVKSLAVGDLDENGFLDVVVAVGDRVQAFFNNGDEGFTSVELADVMNPSTLSLAYVDEDMHLDIIIGNDGQTTNHVHFNTGNRTFTPIALPKTGALTRSIAAVDLNGDKLIDLVFGNEGESNQVIFNKGDRSFDSAFPLKLGGDIWNTSSVIVADFDDDSHADIIVANIGSSNKMFWNLGNGSSYDVAELDGGTKDTNDLSVGDINFDGWIDVVLANRDDVNHILWNEGNRTFQAEVLVGNETKDTRGTAISDFDNDGALDILFGHDGHPSQILLYNPIGKSCDNGGARIHMNSWCFKCPSYMGRRTFLGKQVSACVECMSDHMQESSSEQCTISACSNKTRSLGKDQCVPCPGGTFYDSSVIRELKDLSTWDLPRCHDCQPGRFSDGSELAIDECKMCPVGQNQSESGQSECSLCPAGHYSSQKGQAECSPCSAGYFQRERGKDACEICEIGYYQPEAGQDECEPCERGGYCNVGNSCGGGFLPCDPGTYNNKTGQSDPSACLECPAGSFSQMVGATDVTMCKPCPKGSYTNEDGQSKCTLCSPGSYQPDEGQSSCLACSKGTYANNPGLIECTRCPFRLNSTDNSGICSVCDAGFYLTDPSVDKISLFQEPGKFCKECPPNADCRINSTLDTIITPPNFWRDSLNTGKLYKCNNNACKGSASLQTRSLNTHEASSYCIEDHSGPLCQVCTEDSNYFSSSVGKCQQCPSSSRLLIPLSVLAGVILSLFLCRYAIRQIEGLDRIVEQVMNVLSRTSFQAKIKIMISFYQIVNTLDDIYGISIDKKLQGWFDFLQLFNFGILEMTTIPSSCIGSMKTRLVLNSLWPYFLVLTVFWGVCCYELVIRIGMRLTEQDKEKDIAGLKKVLWMRFLSISIIIFYLVLPSVAMGIFDAIKCESFDTNDQEGETSSYLIADWSVTCGSKDHQELLRMFWFMFIIWIVFVPLGFLGILLYVRTRVQSRAISPLTEACAFLWRDYEEATMFWEVIDLIRKIFLTGLIMFIDTQEGSDKILRIIIAIIVSAFYFGILAYARPYRRDDDLSLAFIGSLLTICCFVFGLMMQLCDDSETCKALIGNSLTSYKASVLAVVVTAGMLVITVLFISVHGYTAIVTPSIKIASTGQDPILEIPENCKFHVFCSHIWSTGQDKTHSMVQKMQLMVPGLKVWLDVNNLTEVGELEQSVKETAVFILFYTKGYFQSFNCRREVIASVETNTPTIVLYENYSNVDDMTAECKQYCGADSQKILDHIFANDPVLWLGRSPLPYAIESVKVLSQRILKHLPRYLQHPDDLKKGVTIANEFDKVSIPDYRNLVYCRENDGADGLAEEIRDMAKKDSHSVMDILEAEDFFSDENDISTTSGEYYLLLYLKNGIFCDSEGVMYDKFQRAMKSGVKIVLVHEQDPSRGAVEFCAIMTQTPIDLRKQQIYNEMAIPLHTFEDYRVISLRQALTKMGGLQTSEPRWRRSIRNPLSLLLPNKSSSSKESDVPPSANMSVSSKESDPPSNNNEVSPPPPLNAVSHSLSISYCSTSSSDDLSLSEPSVHPPKHPSPLPTIDVSHLADDCSVSLADDGSTSVSSVRPPVTQELLTDESTPSTGSCCPTGFMDRLRINK